MLEDGEGENEYDGGVKKDEGVNVDDAGDENNNGENECGDDFFLCRFLCLTSLRFPHVLLVGRFNRN